MNTQAPEQRSTDPDVLQVHSIFQTIQGEGPFAGTPAVFIRLAGCNLCCPGCDTDYTSLRKAMSIQEAAQAVLGAAMPKTRLLVVTGGEPGRQAQALDKLITKLVPSRWMFQIETNGTLDFEVGTYHKAKIVVSPKTGKISALTARQAAAFKYVVAAGEVDPLDGLPTKALGCSTPPARPPEGYGGPIYVQPFDNYGGVSIHTNERHGSAAVESCLRYGHILCLQTHKLLGLP